MILAWLSAELNSTTNKIELWNVSFEKVGELKHGEPVHYFTLGTPSIGTIVWDGTSWNIQTRTMQKIPFPNSPYGLIVKA